MIIIYPIFYKSHSEYINQKCIRIIVMLILASETVFKHIFCENLAVIECTPPEIRGGGLIEKYAFGAVILIWMSRGEGPNT